jgi:hypothetical protein
MQVEVKVSISGCPPRPQLLVAGPRRAPKCFEQFPPWRIRSWPMTMDDALNCCTRDELCPTPRKWPRSVKRQPSSIRASFCRWMQIWLSAAKSLLFVVVDAQCGPVGYFFLRRRRQWACCFRLAQDEDCSFSLPRLGWNPSSELVIWSV